jgi:starch synthase
LNGRLALQERMMKIAMVSPEIVPFAKTGGLADVVGTLSTALGQYGHEMTLIMPAHRTVLQGGFALEDTGMRFSVPLANRQEEASVLRARAGSNVCVYCIRADRYFDREYLYGTPAGDYPDNAERFVFFSRAALEILKHEPVELLHCHDWQSAPAIVFVKAQPERYAELHALKTVFTVHNLGFQGIFPPSDWPLLNLDWSLFTPQHLEFYGNINFLKGALVVADKITTVSPSYAREIIEIDQGFGLDGVLRDRQRDIVGILNGVDYSQWNPQNDPHIAKQYGAATLAAKQNCKKALQRIFALPQQSDLPILGMISRLTSQKGLDLIETILDPLMQSNLQMTILGSGEPRYEELFNAAAARYRQKIAARIGIFDEPLAHQIEAGADFFLMPSRYEPCGLNQMFSLKYGTIPIVRAIGGLKDTVEDYDAERGTGTGFVFSSYEPQALLGAIDRGLQVFRDKRAWTALRRRAMAKDFSWDRSARMYDELYGNLLTGSSKTN